MSIRVLFVCMGNICRSPTAHALFREQVDRAGLATHIEIDSAGTHAYHVGNAPDARAIATARARGINMADLRARQVHQDDYSQFDYIVAMDEENLSVLLASCPEAERARLSLMLDWTTGWGREVPDPYYGEEDGFGEVLDILEAGCPLILQTLAGEDIFEGEFDEEEPF